MTNNINHKVRVLYYMYLLNWPWKNLDKVDPIAYVYLRNMIGKMYGNKHNDVYHEKNISELIIRDLKYDK